jgi:hypothetical protein
MNSADSRRTWSGRMRGLARRIAAVLAECRYAQRRMAVLRTAADKYSSQPDKAPDNYAEFLFRTSGVLLHEPSARARAGRAQIR